MQGFTFFQDLTEEQIQEIVDATVDALIDAYNKDCGVYVPDDKREEAPYSMGSLFYHLSGRIREAASEKLDKSVALVGDEWSMSLSDG